MYILECELRNRIIHKNEIWLKKKMLCVACVHSLNHQILIKFYLLEYIHICILNDPSLMSDY